MSETLCPGGHTAATGVSLCCQSLELQNKTIFHCWVKTGSCDYTGKYFLNRAKIHILLPFFHITNVVDTLIRASLVSPTSAHVVILIELRECCLVVEVLFRFYFFLLTGFINQPFNTNILLRRNEFLNSLKRVNETD